MSDPFSIAAGAVQIADVALRTAQQIYAFLGDLHSAPEDVRQLRAVLGETEDLMRSIISYISEFQEESRVNQNYRYLPSSLESAVKWFADDMKQLRRCLPATLEISFASRVKFVFREKDVRKITARLQERKGTMSTVLSTIGRRNDLTLQRGVNAITSSVDVVRQQQTRTLITVQDAVTTLQQGVSDLYQLRQASESQHTQVVTRLQSLEASLSSPPTASRPPLSLTADNLPDDPDLISRIVRREIKEALEPFAGVIAGRLDSVVESSAREILSKLQETPDKEVPTHTSTVTTTHRESGLDTSNQPAEPFLLDTPGKRPRSTDVQLSRTWHSHKSRFGDLEIYVCKFRRRSEDSTRSSEVYFQTRVDFRPASWITSYGVSASYSTAPDALGYFEICPRLLPFRVLAVRSKASCAILCDDVPWFKDLINRGEINWFDQFSDSACRTFLEVALYMKCPRICRFLLCDFPVEASHLFRTGSYLVGLASTDPNMFAHKLGPYRLREMADIYPLLIDYIPDEHLELWQSISFNYARLAGYGVNSDMCLELARVAERSFGLPWAFPGYEMALSIPLPISEDLSRERWFLDLYLSRDGDPNMRAPRSQKLPLQAALDLATCCFPRRWPAVEDVLIKAVSLSMSSLDDLRLYLGGGTPRFTLGYVVNSARILVEEYGESQSVFLWLCIMISGGNSPEDILSSFPHDILKRMAACTHAAARWLEAKWGMQEGSEAVADNTFDPDKHNGNDPLMLLVPLIESGADVHALVTDMEGFQWTLTGYASCLELEDVWSRALEQCGYSPVAVEAESNRRMAHAIRLNEGSASGIDTSSLELPGVSGLRRRRQGRDLEVP